MYSYLVRSDMTMEELGLPLQLKAQKCVADGFFLYWVLPSNCFNSSFLKSLPPRILFIISPNPIEHTD